MAIERSSKSDKEWRQRASDLDTGEGEVTWRDFLVDLSPLWEGDEGDAEVTLEPREVKGFQTKEEFEEFWKRCDEVAGPGREPDWEEHLKTINESRMRGLPDV